MNNQVRYSVVDKTLIIESCPPVLTRKILDNLRGYNFERIELCEGIEEIEDRAFIDYSFLTEIVLPKSIKFIGKEAFRECFELKEIILPEGVKEIKDLTFYKCMSLEKVTLGKNLEVIGNKGFEYCPLASISLPDSVTCIGNEAFSFCFDLKNIKLSRNLKKIGKKAFYLCVSLRKIELCNGLLELGESSFESCKYLKSIIIPSSVTEIKNRTFFGCDGLCNVSFHSGLKRIGNSAFENCRRIKQISKLEGVEIIGDAAFYDCENLESVELGDNVEEIHSRAFAHCTSLISIIMKESVVKLGSEAFYNCVNLRNVTLSSNIKVIEAGTFQSCRSLSEIHFPEGIVEIKQNAFKECNQRLERVVFPKSLVRLGEYAFSECSSLKDITINEGLSEIPSGAFSLCTSLEVLSLPSSIEVFNNKCLSYCGNALKKIILNTKNGAKEFDFNSAYLVDNVDNKFMIYNPLFGTYTFYANGECVEFNKSIFQDKERVMKMIDNGLIESNNFIRLYYWCKRRFIPGDIVIKNMPLNDIDKFYVNDNSNVWKKLVIDSKFSSSESLSSFFKLCYVSGIFSESSSIRDKAVEFLNKNIIGVLYEFDIHSKFDGFDLSNGFNEEYAEFFIKYYNNGDFLIYTDEQGNEVDLMAASYNNFKFVKKNYPNKTLHTNRSSDILLPIHVMNAVKRNYYYNVDEGNENLALIVGGYGYNQEQFEKLQSFYHIAKRIDEKEMKLFVGVDSGEGITYELLSKDNPINAVLGNITNCCQVLSGAGESCLEYGITQPNSGFITFNYKDKIIGQSWVWYDEDSKVVCLDNIEVPRKYCEKIEINKKIQKSFIECLIRLKESFRIEMKKRGLDVKKVTIGRGYNDIKIVLDEYFDLLEFNDLLTDYTGYSDASEQYEIKLKEKVKKGSR